MLLTPRKNLTCGTEEVGCREHFQFSACVQEQVGLTCGEGGEHRGPRWGESGRGRKEEVAGSKPGKAPQSTAGCRLYLDMSTS